MLVFDYVLVARQLAPTLFSGFEGAPNTTPYVTMNATRTSAPTGKNTPISMSPILSEKTHIYTAAIIATENQQLATIAALESNMLSPPLLSRNSCFDKTLTIQRLEHAWLVSSSGTFEAEGKRGRAVGHYVPLKGKIKSREVDSIQNLNTTSKENASTGVKLIDNGPVDASDFPKCFSGFGACEHGVQNEV